MAKEKSTKKPIINMTEEQMEAVKADPQAISFGDAIHLLSNTAKSPKKDKKKAK